MKQKERVFRESLQTVVGERFGRYSKYIIQDRALPDVRDGLKPVQRRILYAMHVYGNTSQKNFRKSAKTVGNVIGNYHPHGDSSVYEAMVRLSQDWKMNVPLVSMHGNNGSIDGDSAAAMRYTEARLSLLAELLLKNIDKETVDFIPNFDDTDSEPTVLPARYPNLLVNGSTGISAGYATDIPPHNFNEVIDATIYLIGHPKASVEDLMQFIKGPDFPGGAIVQGIDGIKAALTNGKGKIVIRSKVERTKKRDKLMLVITEIPYEVNKANLVRQMDEIRLNKKIDGIQEIRDESDRTGLRIIVEMRKDANVEAIENYFYKNTDLQINYNYNMVSIFHGHPMLMGVREMLSAYIEHQLHVLTRRTKYDLQKALKRAHIVEGLIKALSILDEVIATIRRSSNRQDAINNLVEAYAFTSEQATAIVQLQLYRLTNTDVVALEEEAKELQENIDYWNFLLAQEKNMRKELVKELKAVNKETVVPRRARVEEEVTDIVIEADALIAKRAGIVSVSRDGYVKFASTRSYNASGGEGHGHKPSDALIGQYEMDNMQTIVAITSGGNYLFVPVHTIPEKRWKETGVHFSTLVQYDTSEKIVAAYGFDAFIADVEELVITSRNGYIKRIDVADLKLQRYSRAAKLMNLKDDDEVVAVQKIPMKNKDLIIVVTKDGYYNCFGTAEVPVAGIKAGGVKAIKLGTDDIVAGTFVGTDKDSLVLFTNNNKYKRVAVNSFPYTGRYKKGTRVIRKLKTQTDEIIGLTPYSVETSMMSNGQTQQRMLDQLPLDDLNTRGKNIDMKTNITNVAWLSRGKIVASKTAKTGTKVASDVDKTADELTKMLEEQGVLFDGKE